MGKKILGMICVGLVLALIIPIGSAYATYDKELTALGIIRIDAANCEIKGFVFIGNNDGKTLRFSFINIKYDDRREPLTIDGQIPLFIHNIKYNPAK
jgi:hypothetical protein